MLSETPWWKARHIYESDERKESTGSQAFGDQRQPLRSDKETAWDQVTVCRFNVGNDEIIEFRSSLAKIEFELEGVREWLMKSVKSK